MLSFFRNGICAVVRSTLGIATAYSAEEPAATATPVATTKEKSANIMIGPLGFLIGSFNIVGDFGIGEHLAIGPYLSMNPSSTGNAGGGLHLIFYPSAPRFKSSWYISPQVGYSNGYNAYTAPSWTAAIPIQVTGGYQWFWDSGFNLQAGLGAYYNVQLSSGVSSGAGLSVDLRIGWAF